MEREFQRDLLNVVNPLEIDPAKQQIYPKYYKGQFEYIIEGDLRQNEFPNIYPRYGALIFLNSPHTAAQFSLGKGMIWYLRNRWWLTTLRIHSCFLYQQHLSLIHNMKYLKELDLSKIVHNQVGNYIAQKGLQYVSRLVSLKVLNLADNPVGDQGTDALLKLKNLRQIDLRHTSLTIKGLRKILKGMHLMVVITMYMRRVKPQEMDNIFTQFPDIFIIA